MKRIIFVIWVCAALLALANVSSPAKVWLNGSNGQIVGGGSVGYQGPGDIASGAIGFWSAGRAYNKAYATAQNPLADLVDTTTGLLQCTMNAGTNGYANLTATVCPKSAPVANVVTWCTLTVGGCSVTKLYDQTGNGNHVTQATLANMPTLGFSSLNGLPCVVGAASTMNLSTASSLSQSAPYSVTAVAERTGSVTTAQRISLAASTQALLAFRNAANTVEYDSGTLVTLTAADSAPHALLAVTSSTDPLFAADSSANTVTTTNGTNAINAVYEIPSTLSAGFVCESGLWPSDQNASYVALLANMRSSSNGWNF